MIYSNGVLYNQAITRILFCPPMRWGNYVIAGTVTNIADSAFQYSGLSGVVIPDSVVSIGHHAFSEGYGITNITVGSGVTTIGYAAFNACQSLTSICFPGKVSAIGDSAFMNCTQLTRLMFGGNAPTVPSVYVFYNCNAYVYYRPNTSGWGAQLGSLYAFPWNPEVQTAGPDFGLKNGKFGFTITGLENIPLAIEATTNLATGNWQLASICTLTNGSIYFADEESATQPVRFYRIRWP